MIILWVYLALALAWGLKKITSDIIMYRKGVVKPNRKRRDYVTIIFYNTIQSLMFWWLHLIIRLRKEVKKYGQRT